jgi:hypothetical protein
MNPSGLLPNSAAGKRPKSGAGSRQIARQMIAGTFVDDGIESISILELDNSYEHKADYVL